MKNIIIGLVALSSISAFASDVELKVDLSRHMGNLSNAILGLTYESQSKALGCRTYTGDILNPLRAINIEKSIPLYDGLASEAIKTELSHCKAKLVSVNIKLRLDRDAVAHANQASKSDVDKNRIDCQYSVFVFEPGQVVEAPKLKIVKNYVAGSDKQKFTMVCGAKAVPVIDNKINLSL
ncbi:MAG: hypothetical protein ACOYL6_15870 [Bacteriovoracaceae bacterium]